MRVFRAEGDEARGELTPDEGVPRTLGSSQMFSIAEGDPVLETDHEGEARIGTIGVRIHAIETTGLAVPPQGVCGEGEGIQTPGEFVRSSFRHWTLNREAIRINKLADLRSNHQPVLTRG
ncbi:MAG: hypothetical protein HC933_01360 [Pleurocapsa sp. SU_196_0]|nr:hypothetical protein [Pleurocapsa sp. SU_196_0]